MTTIKKLIIKKYGNLNRFAVSMGWSYQRASYIANKNPLEMNLKKINEIAIILECKKEDLI
jgi:DNA-binding Xre family transcriptional regulator